MAVGALPHILSILSFQGVSETSQLWIVDGLSGMQGMVMLGCIFSFMDDMDNAQGQCWQ